MVDNDDSDDATERFSNDTSVYRANQTKKKDKKHYPASYLIYLRIFRNSLSAAAFQSQLELRDWMSPMMMEKMRYPYCCRCLS